MAKIKNTIAKTLDGAVGAVIFVLVLALFVSVLVVGERPYFYVQPCR